MAHRAILMSASGYFETMLTGTFGIKVGEVISLGDAISFEALEKLVKFLYTGQLAANAVVSLEDLLCAADYLQIASAITKLIGPISKAIDKTNVLRFWNLRGMIKEPLAISMLRLFILMHFQQIVYDRSFLALDLETISWIVESDELVVESEAKVFQAIKMWINHDPTARQPHFVDLLARVRYDARVSVSTADAMDFVYRGC